MTQKETTQRQTASQLANRVIALEHELRALEAEGPAAGPAASALTRIRQHGAAIQRIRESINETHLAYRIAATAYGSDDGRDYR
jgi:hypothetical protein